ncbi:hypothetical protein Tco_0878795 [Tanacetum coccineum]|uniref:Uncharacterized protein n=1 Tax=Tanacetum coccineum TaxID=301880 RepID=A0ABQ5C0Q7_9ASTR
MGEGSTNPNGPHHIPTIIQPSTSQPQKKQKPRRSKRKDIEIPQSSGPTNNVTDEAVNEEMDDSLERAATTATSLDAEQDRAQEITSLKRRIKRLENKNRSKTHGLKRLYKVGLSARIESSEDEGLGEEDASKQGRIDGDKVIVETEVASKDVNLSVDEVTLAQALAALKSAKPKADKVMLQEPEQGTITTTTAATTVTTASTRPKAKGLVIHEEEQATTPIVSSQQPSHVKVQDKGKGIMEEPEKPTKRKDQIRHDEEVAQRLQAQMQAELEEEDRLVRQREEEANIVSWDNVQAMIDVDYQMAQQMQAEEQEKLSIEEKSKLFVQLLEARKKHFAAIRAKEKRNKPPTKAQKRNTMSTYLKNMARYKHNQLKNKSFDDIQKLFDKAMKRVNTFVDMDTELVEGSEVRAEAEIAQESSSKRAGTKLEQESIKKQKVDKDKETTKLQRLIEVVPDKEEVAIDVIPLATKPPKHFFSHMLKSFDREDLETLWKLVKAKHGSTRPEEGYERVLWGDLKTMFLIRRRKIQRCMLVLSHMLKAFDIRRERFEIQEIVKAKHGSTRPEEGYERVLWGDLKTMFDPHVEDQVWRNQQDYIELDWKIYDSCGLHSLRMQHMHIHMLVEKRYPLTAATITNMLNISFNVIISVKWYISFLNFSQNSSRINEGRIVRIKRLHDDLEVTAAKTAGTHDDEVGSSSRPKRTRVTETIKEAVLGHIYHENLLWNNCNRAAKSKYNIVLARLISKQIYSPCIMDWTILNTLGCVETIEEMIEIKVVEMGGNEEIFTYEDWRRAFDIREPTYTELCHEFFSAFEFDEVVTDEELTTKKHIKFRLGGRGHSLTLLEFAHRLGLYTSTVSVNTWVVINSLDLDKNFSSTWSYTSMMLPRVRNHHGGIRVL